MPKEILNNGAEVLEKHPETETILARFRDEFVTWKYNSDGEVYWGHYFKSIIPAVYDYQKRIKKEDSDGKETN
jgi:hypothetical protein